MYFAVIYYVMDSAEGYFGIGRQAAWCLECGLLGEWTEWTD